MCMIYLSHPNHGVKVAYLEAEAVADEKAGWVRFDPKSNEYCGGGHDVRQEETPETAEEMKPRRGRPRKVQ